MINRMLRFASVASDFNLRFLLALNCTAFHDEKLLTTYEIYKKVKRADEYTKNVQHIQLIFPVYSILSL